MWQPIEATYPAGYHPAEFLVAALRERGAEAVFARDERTEGCYGGIVNGRTFVWLIDNRLPHEAAKEDIAAERLQRRGALVLCAQKRDAERVGGKWMPLAVTPSYARHDVLALPRVHEHDLVFIGYVRDSARHDALAHIAQRVNLHVASGVFELDAAALYRRALAGLNVPTLYGAACAYDINMRVFEIAACGVPLITNELPELRLLGFVSFANCFTYRTLDDVERYVGFLKANPRAAVNIGRAGRALVLSRHTYAARAAYVLDRIGNSD